jgi:hypothetical protein
MSCAREWALMKLDEIAELSTIENGNPKRIPSYVMSAAETLILRAAKSERPGS